MDGTQHPTMTVLGRSYSRGDVLLILAHAAICFVLYVAIAAALDDQMIAFAIMIPVVLLTSLVVRRRLWS
jgi:hypothetical protein